MLTIKNVYRAFTAVISAHKQHTNKMIPRELWICIGSFCQRAERELLGFNYDTCIALRMAPCKVQPTPRFLQPLQNALFVRTQLDNEVFIYDANTGKAIYFGVYDYENYEFAVTTNTALTTPTCGEWIVWSGSEERVTLVRSGEMRKHSAIVNKSYCFELRQWPNVILVGGQALKPHMYWDKVHTNKSTCLKRPKRYSKS